MAITRVTQRMMTQGNTARLGGILSRMSKTEEQLTTGKRFNRPSDDPTAVSSSMRLRRSASDQKQYSRNVQDGIGWLSQIDSTLQSVQSQVVRVQTIAIAGADMGSIPQSGLDAYAAEVDQIRQQLISESNATYLDRPVFGGVTSGSSAFTEDAAGNVSYVGVDGSIARTVAKGVTIQVDASGQAVFGAQTTVTLSDGTTTTTQPALFATLTQLSDALRNGNQAGVQAAMAGLDTLRSNISTVNADVGTRMNRLQAAGQSAQNEGLSIASTLSDLEDVDAAQAATDYQMQQTAYQVALSVTAKSITPTLADFLK